MSRYRKDCLSENEHEAVEEKRMIFGTFLFIKAAKISNKACVTLRRNKLSNQHEKTRRHTYYLVAHKQ